MHTNPEVLALLALGEDSATDEERGHVDSCPVCTREVAELAHLAGVGRAVQGAAPLSEPPPEVWDRIRAEIGFDTMNGVAAPAAATQSAVTDLGARTGAAADRESSTDDDREPEAEPPRRAARGRRVMALALAAAIALILGVGIGLGWTALSRPTPTVIGQADLTPPSDNWAGSSGEAVLERNAAGQEILIVRMNTPQSSSGIRQVWMMNPDGAMLPVGIITGNEGEWTVPIDIEADLPVVDVSEEPRDGNPLHSGNSILRGTLNV
jgi:Anti-sigma-K factor rskA